MKAGQGNTPENNKRQNIQFNDAIKNIQKIIRRNLTKDEVRQIHEDISGEGYGYWEIVIIGVQSYGTSDDLDEISRDNVPEGWEWW